MQKHDDFTRARNYAVARSCPRPSAGAFANWYVLHGRYFVSQDIGVAYQIWASGKNQPQEG